MQRSRNQFGNRDDRRCEFESRFLLLCVRFDRAKSGSVSQMNIARIVPYCRWLYCYCCCCRLGSVGDISVQPNLWKITAADEGFYSSSAASDVHWRMGLIRQRMDAFTIFYCFFFNLLISVCSRNHLSNLEKYLCMRIVISMKL